MAEGAFHESINMAALWQLPMLFCCENNLYAMGTALDRSQSQTDLCAKASAYKVDTRSVDGMDVIAVYEAAREAVEHIRAGRGPFFLEFRTYRFRAHSMFDPQLYRDKDEVEQWKTHGPIHTYSAQLKAEGLLDEPGFLAILAQVDAEVEAAVTYAENGSLEPLEDLFRDVYTPRAAP